MRPDGRKNDELRPVRLVPEFLATAEGSVLIEIGLTKVVCAVTVEERVPPFIGRGTGRGWLTAEYGMLPRSTPIRIPRERGAASGRTQEIQRLIGRSLRAITDLGALGEITLMMDCDVLQADGGTRCAAITGGYVALYRVAQRLVKTGLIRRWPLKGAVAAVSVGVVEGEERLDLCYLEDSRAEVDFNVVMTDTGELVEVQGTAEGAPFPRETLSRLLISAEKGIKELLETQQQALKP